MHTECSLGTGARGGSIELLKRGCSGRDIIVAGGDQATDHMSEVLERCLRERRLFGYFPRDETTGYWGDLTRTVCRGEAPTALKKIYNRFKSAKQALKKVRQMCVEMKFTSI